MFRFTIYKNSILATICSLFGTASIAMALLSMLNGELEILPGICVVAVGIGLVILAGEISQHKERKKRAKAVRQGTQPAAGSPTPSRPASTTRPAAAPRKAAAPAKSVNKQLLFAKICCILTALCSFYVFYLYRVQDLDIPFADRLPLVVFVEGILYLMLLAGCFADNEAKVFAPGFLGLAAVNAFVGGSIFLDSMEESELVPVFALKVLAYLMMSVLIIISQRRTDRFPAAVWVVPTVLLMTAGLKMASDNYALHLLLAQRSNDGAVLSARPEYFQLYGQLLGAVAMGCIGLVVCQLMTPSYVVDTSSVRQTAHITCLRCYHANSADSLFCECCGQKLEKPQPSKGLCPQCGYQNSADSLFCQNCGQKLH